MTANLSDESIQAMINRARVQAEQELQAKLDKASEIRRLVNETTLVAYEAVADVVEAAANMGYDAKTCKDLLTAIQLMTLVEKTNYNDGL